jgi:hypothetical protein
MPTLFATYNLKEGKKSEKYDEYLAKTKVPGMRGAPFIASFHTWKVDKVLAPAVSEPEGELPEKSTYQYIAKIEVSDLDAMVAFLGTDAGKEFMKSWSVFLDPTSFFTMGHEVE